MLNPRQLEAFAATVRSGSMTAAARLMGSSQPSVSRFVADLEARLGMPLFVRERGRLRLTHEGACFFAELERYYAGQDELVRRAEEIRRFEGGEVRIATIAAGAPWLVPEAIGRATARLGPLRSSLQMRSTGRVTDFLTLGRADIGLLNALAPGVPVRQARSWALPCLTVLPPGHRLAAADAVTASDLAGECLISVGLEFFAGACADARTLKAIEAATFRKVNLSLPACGQVAAGLGIALSDPLTARLAADLGLLVRPFRPAIPYPVTLAETAVGRPTRLAAELFDEIATLLDAEASRAHA